MNRRPLKFITREKEEELINKLITIVDSSNFDPSTTCVLMVSPDYSGTVAMHLAHAWSRNGDIIPIIPIDVPYPDEQPDDYINEFHMQARRFKMYSKLVLVEAGIIRGGNWEWLIRELKVHGYDYANTSDVTLVALCENVNSRVKSDYVGEYYDDEKEELMFYFERFNKHWPIK